MNNISRRRADENDKLNTTSQCYGFLHQFTKSDCKLWLTIVVFFWLVMVWADRLARDRVAYWSQWLAGSQLNRYDFNIELFACIGLYGKRWSNARSAPSARDRFNKCQRANKQSQVPIKYFYSKMPREPVGRWASLDANFRCGLVGGDLKLRAAIAMLQPSICIKFAIYFIYININNNDLQWWFSPLIIYNLSSEEKKFQFEFEATNASSFE